MLWLYVIRIRTREGGGFFEDWEEKRWSIESIYDSGLGNVLIRGS